jgi:CelD/BcsL family acetyltransferase involved in cellulose biosynthesis
MSWEISPCKASRKPTLQGCGDSSIWRPADGKARKKSAILSDPCSLQFFDEAAREAQRFGYLRLYYLELNGKLISAHFGLSYEGRYYAPKIAYDAAYREYRAGHLILRKIMTDCAQQGIAEYSMGVLEE